MGKDIKRVAIVGSSGGNLYAQGGDDPYTMMDEMFAQGSGVDIEISFIQFIGASGSMDTISMDAKANLYFLEQGHLCESETKTLKEINQMAAQMDAKLASQIEQGQIDALILLSCDPKGVNHQALMMAAKKQIPVTGTGGTSMANAQALGCRVISASGTTGTTNRTRAISAMAALAKEWHLKYQPVIKSGQAKVQQGNVWKRINIHGIMMASLPGFIAMALCLALSKVPGCSGLEKVFNNLIAILPVILAAIAARQVSGLDEVGIVAGVIAGSMASDGGIIGGLIAGILAGVLSYYLLNLCFSHNVPGTTANIVAGGLSGLAAGLVGMVGIAPIALALGNGINSLITLALKFNPILAGGFAGFAIWFALMGGVYHAAILPIVMLEMEAHGFSFLGSIDMNCLVMVCAGIQVANILHPRRKSDRVACIPSLFINLVFGTFVEAAYPFMFASKKVFGATILAATLSGVLVGFLGVKGTAYIPSFMAPFMANPNHGIQTLFCMMVSLALGCFLTLLANLSEKTEG